jgi:hypothetical protein
MSVWWWAYGAAFILRILQSSLCGHHAFELSTLSGYNQMPTHLLSVYMEILKMKYHIGIFSLGGLAM